MAEIVEEQDATPPADTEFDLKVAGRRQDITLKKVFAGFGLAAMTAQLLIANVVFWRYGATQGWSGIPSPVITAYFAWTVVYVVGIVRVMTRSLFLSPPQPEEQRIRALTRPAGARRAAGA